MKFLTSLIYIVSVLFINSCNKNNLIIENKSADASKIEIQIVSAAIRFDTSINVCATILNKSDNDISIFPPEFGARLPLAQYGVLNNLDTLWLDASSDIDYDTYPEVRIPKRSKYTFAMRPGYIELWKRDVNAKFDKDLSKLMNSTEYIAVKYLTGLIDSLNAKSDRIDSVYLMKYQRLNLESNFVKVSGHSLCDTGVRKLIGPK